MRRVLRITLLALLLHMMVIVEAQDLVVTLPGTFGSELGCAEDTAPLDGDWEPGCMLTQMRGPFAMGLYIFETDAIPAGNWEVKVTVNGTWEENYGADGVPNGENIVFDVPANGTEMRFTWDARSKLLDIEVIATPTAPTPAMSGHGNNETAPPSPTTPPSPTARPDVEDDCPVDQVRTWFHQLESALTVLQTEANGYAESGRYLEPAILMQQQRRLLEDLPRPACLESIHVKTTRWLNNFADAYTLLAASEDIIPRRTESLLGVSAWEVHDYVSAFIQPLYILGEMQDIERRTGVNVFTIISEPRPENPNLPITPIYEEVTCTAQSITGWIERYATVLDRANGIHAQYASNDQYLEPAIVVQEERRQLMAMQVPACMTEIATLVDRFLIIVGDFYTLQSAYDIVGERNTNDLIGIPGYEKNDYLQALVDFSFYNDRIDSLLLAVEAQYAVDVYTPLDRVRPEVVDLIESGDITLGEITIVRTDVENVLSVEQVVLPNCNGINDFRMNQTFTKESARTVRFGGEASLQSTLDISANYWAASMNLTVEAYLMAYFDYERDERIIQSVELEFVAPPGYTLRRDVRWVEVSSTGYIEVIRDRQIYLLEFTIPSTLRVVLGEPEYDTCE